MNSTSSFILFAIGAFVGFGVHLSLVRCGISLFEKETRAKALGYLTLFSSAWVTGMTLITHFFPNSVPM